MGFTRQVYGHSVLGTPLEVYLPDKPVQTLIVGCLHGDEPETTWMLARVLETVSTSHAAIVLTMNPDGLMRGIRGNANNVDLNRNFPDSNWYSHPAMMYPPGTPLVPELREKQDMTVPWSTGSHAGSEPETKALMKLCEDLGHPFLVNVHTPLNKLMMSGPSIAGIGEKLSKLADLPLLVQPEGVIDPHLDGCLRAWYAEKGYPCLTYEFPYAPLTHLMQTQLAPLQLLTQSHDTWA